MAYLLNCLYVGLLLCLSPVICWRMIRHGRYRRGGMQKLLGWLAVPAADRPVVWFHAVSVGEVLQLQKIVQSFRSATNDGYHIVITTSTDTGYDLATNRFDGCDVTWCPLDFSWAVKNAVRRLRPELLVLMELEIWPNLLKACQRNGVATAVVNARMSDKSFRGYQRIRGLIAPLLSHLSLVAAQSQESADRLIRLGARTDRTVVTGSVKFDGVQTERQNSGTESLRRLFGIGPDETVFIAGSTQAPEETYALDIWLRLQDRFPELRLILVPRHRERFEEVAGLVESRNLPLMRRSKLQSDTEPGVTGERPAVILLDTIGELSACWGLADVAFVGGSFGSRGGQNMLEPAAYGSAVLFGPKTRNFRDIVRLLLAEDAALQVDTPDELGLVVEGLLSERDRLQAYGERAKQVVLSHQGAVDRTVDQLGRLLVSDGEDACVSGRSAA
jgi:3-deoxy-D-manno-octulosonic-acid transferase